MTCSLSNRQSKFIVIGKIEKAHGISGHVKVKPITDYPPRFKFLSTVKIETPTGEMQKLDIASASVRDRSVILKFDGIVTRDQAEALRGSFIYIPKEEALPLDKGSFYHFEIVGFEVKTQQGVRFGNVEEVLDLPANAVLVVKNGEREFLIPVIKDVVKKIDKESCEIIIDPIEGLLD